MDTGKQLARSRDIGIKIARVFQKRTSNALQHFNQRVSEALSIKADKGNKGADHPAGAMALFDPRQSYVIDTIERSILFWDVLRQRGNAFVERSTKASEPVLHFDYETILDGRTFDRPVNYALLRITPPAGVTIDPTKRPYLIIDPRAGHGAGIGGFKDDSQTGVALRAGHPVYFVIFFRDPEPGQTMLDVCAAEEVFVKKVRALHPDSDKPAIIGNCQGGWSAMMLASSDPEDTGPLVINGAPMSYWGGAWSEGEGDNPMRYTGGLLGGTWLSSLTADLGNGKFDGAHLVQNFENLNPANSLWDKFYNLYKNIDTEPPRYLDFERWWGSYYLMNREEIEWITRNLFVGNKIWTGEVKGAGGQGFDLRAIKMPIVLFASMGDNITPPQQAFNWVADTYSSTEEIKARGQVIVGLVHQDIGHLGIFVSGKVAKKEHTQIVSVLNQIEMLPPGLYGMHITEKKDGDGAAPSQYEVEFQEHRLEDISARINRFERADEQPFEAVTAVSDVVQRGYEVFLQPVVQASATEASARLLRALHPLRLQNWAISDLNPLLWWLEPAARQVASRRQPLEADHPARQLENVGATLISASLDLYRDMRDAMTESLFFSIYANLYALYGVGKSEAGTTAALAAPAAVEEPRALPFVKDALASIAEGGYTEGFARVAYLLSRKDDTLPLSRVVMRHELAESYAGYLPELPLDQWRRIRGEQEIIARYEPEKAIATLPALLGNRTDRERLITLLEKLMADERVQSAHPTPEQLAMLDRIREVLDVKPTPVLPRRPAAVPADNRFAKGP